MKITIYVLPILIASIIIPARSQDTFGKYLDTRQRVDVGISYTDNATPHLTGKNVNYRVAYSRNYLLLPGNGVDEPVIGFNLTGSSNFANYMRDSAQAKYSIMQEGWLNFTPSLYLRTQPEKNSKLNLFLNAGGGLKFFRTFAHRDSAEAQLDKHTGLFPQAIFSIGGGFDYDQKFSLVFNYNSTWNNVTTASEQYYLDHVSNNNRTFSRYINARATVKLFDIGKQPLSAFIEWDQCRYPFKASMIRGGLSCTIGCNKRTTVKRDDVDDLNDRLTSLRTVVVKSNPVYKRYGDRKNELLARIDYLQNKLKTVTSKKEYYEVLKEIKALSQEINNLEDKSNKLDSEIKQLEKNQLPDAKTNVYYNQALNQLAKNAELIPDTMQRKKELAKIGTLREELANLQTADEVEHWAKKARIKERLQAIKQTEQLTTEVEKEVKGKKQRKPR